MTLTVTDNGGATATTTPSGDGVAAAACRVCWPPTRSAGPSGRAAGARPTSAARGRTRRPSAFSVSGGAGNLSMAAGSGPSAYLNGVSARDVDLMARCASTRRRRRRSTPRWSPAGSGRRTTGSRSGPGCPSTSLDLVRTISGAETVLASQVVPGFVMSPRTRSTCGCRPSATGRRRCGPSSGSPAQPSRRAWNLTATDTTAALQAPGAVGFYSYMGSSATNAPVTLQVQDFAASTP